MRAQAGDSGSECVADLQVEASEVVRLASKALTGAAAGRLHPVIAREFPLASAVAAHRAIEERSIAGKALLIP